MRTKTIKPWIFIGSLLWFACASPESSADVFDLLGRPCDDGACCDDCPSSCDSVCCDDTCGCDGGSSCDAKGCDCSLEHGLTHWFDGRSCGSSSCDCPKNYVSILGGWNGLLDYNGEEEIIPPPPTPTLRRGTFNDGWAIGGAWGRQWNECLRGEFEFAFRSNDADEWFVNGAPAGAWDGDLLSYSIMGNLYHDIQAFQPMGWTPYLGAGIGISFLDGEFNTTTLNLEIEEELFAYQFMAGASRSLTESLDLFVEYRYFATANFDLVNVTTPPPVNFGEDPYESNNVLLGFRILR